LGEVRWNLARACHVSLLFPLEQVGGIGIAIAGWCREAQGLVQGCCRGPDAARSVVLKADVAIARPALDRCQSRALPWLAEFLQVTELEDLADQGVTPSTTRNRDGDQSQLSSAGMWPNIAVQRRQCTQSPQVLPSGKSMS